MKACVNCEKGVIQHPTSCRTLDVSRTQMRFTWGFSQGQLCNMQVKLVSFTVLCLTYVLSLFTIKQGK
jgi:hypothetical protein